MRIRAAALIAGGALAVGTLAGAVFLPPLLPDSAAAIDEPRLVPVISRDFDDLHTVSAVPTLSQQVEIPLTGGSGTVTTSSCEPGSSVTFGDKLLSVDGVPRLALVTSVPLWRELWPGTKGPDVEALQQALLGAGYDVATDGTYGDATEEAVLELQAAAAVEETGAILLDQVQWIPSDLGSVASCEIRVGSLVSAGEPLLTAGGGLVELALSTAATELPGRDYSVVIGDLEVPLSTNRTVTDPAFLKAVSASTEYTDWKADPTRGVSVTVRLTEPELAMGVPPSAVIVTDALHGCVAVSIDETVPVEILASELGTVYVISEKPVSEVLIPASEVADSCK